MQPRLVFSRRARERATPFPPAACTCTRPRVHTWRHPSSGTPANELDTWKAGDTTSRAPGLVDKDRGSIFLRWARRLEKRAPFWVEEKVPGSWNCLRQFAPVPGNVATSTMTRLPAASVQVHVGTIAPGSCSRVSACVNDRRARSCWSTDLGWGLMPAVLMAVV